MKELNDIVSENLVALRKAKKMTQQELAEQIGYSDKSISKWELGYAIPTVDILIGFAKFYGVSVDFLISEHNEGVSLTNVDEQKRKKNNQIVITSMVATFIWFTAACIYATDVIQHGIEASTLWIAFVWAIPISFFACSALSRVFWGKCLVFTIFQSLFVWTIILSFYLQFLLFYPYENLWYIFLVCIPLQIGIILLSKLKN
jgi:transcriptional regulator with XRE-family HTH domain